MRARTWAAASLTGLACLACPPGRALDLEPLQSGLDYHSFANVEQFVITRLQLDVRVDPKDKVLRAVAGLSLKRLDPGATELVLDTRDLDIQGVAQKAQGVLGATAKSETTWVSRPFHFERKDPVLGQALVIELPPSGKTTELVRIEYETAPGAPGLTWVDAAHTAGGSRPIFYTRSEPIGARSWIPLQDSPQMRLTVVATVHTPPDVIALMGAGNDPKVKRNGEYAFAQSDPVPPHLLTLVVGDFRFAATGARTGVYAEKPLLKASAAEFADTELLLRAQEGLFGPMAAKRQDIVVLTKDFPVGGFETAELAAVSPTLLAGDKALVGGIAHELAHGWAGVRAGHATWRDAWIEEAICSYVESRSMATIYGERSDQFDRAQKYLALRAELAGTAPAEQALALDLRGRPPDEAFRPVVYGKGLLLFEDLEARFGRARVDALLHSYIDSFGGRSATTEQFVDFLRESLIDRAPGSMSRARLDGWVFGAAIPDGAALPPADALVGVDAAREDWVGGRLATKDLAARIPASAERRYFLDSLSEPMTAARLAEVDQAFGLSRAPDAELEARWFALTIRQGYQPAQARLERYLESVGRAKLIIPLYDELMKTPAGAVQARRVYALARGRYHPAVAAAIDAIVDNPPENDDDQ